VEKAASFCNRLLCLLCGCIVTCFARPLSYLWPLRISVIFYISAILQGISFCYLNIPVSLSRIGSLKKGYWTRGHLHSGSEHSLRETMSWNCSQDQQQLPWSNTIRFSFSSSLHPFRHHCSLYGQKGVITFLTLHEGHSLNSSNKTQIAREK
jgi:hypothetical protein